MIDWSHIDELKADMGDSFDEIVEVFLEEVDDSIAKLAASDSAGLASCLHFLKGAALNLGFTEFAALCSTGEVQADSGAAAQVDVARVRICYQKSRQEFVAGLQSRAA